MTSEWPLTRPHASQRHINTRGCQTMCRQTDVPKDDVPTGRFAERRFTNNVRTMCRQIHKLFVRIIFMKLFRTSDMEVINFCQLACKFVLPSVQTAKRRECALTWKPHVHSELFFSTGACTDSQIHMKIFIHHCYNELRNWIILVGTSSCRHIGLSAHRLHTIRACSTYDIQK